MNLIEAVKKAQEGFAIMCLEQREWIIVSGGTLRWKSNRTPVNLNIRDIMSIKWISEDQLIKISRLQIMEALDYLRIDSELDNSSKLSFSEDSKDKFFEYIMACSYQNRTSPNDD